MANWGYNPTYGGFNSTYNDRLGAVPCTNKSSNQARFGWLISSSEVPNFLEMLSGGNSGSNIDEGEILYRYL